MNKYLLFSSIIILFMTYNSIIAQPPNPSDSCGQSINCEKKARPFGFCNSEGLIVYFCDEGPFNFDGGDPDGGGEGWYDGFNIPLKLNNDAIPLCLEFDNSGPESVKGDICGNQECHIGQIYYKNDFISDMNEAVKKWKCVRGWDDNDCGCTVKIGFVDENHNEFRNPEEDFASTTLENQLTDWDYSGVNAHKIIGNGSLNKTNCEISCDDLHIYLNNTPEHTRPKSGEPDYYQGNFYVSKTICDNWNPDDWDGGEPQSMNLRNVIAMELGKLYGFTFKTDYGVSCSRSDGIMNPGGSSLKYKNLNTDEKCAFMILYCPDVVSVEKTLLKEQINLEVIPNPSNKFSSLKFFSDANYNNIYLFTLNNLGEKIKSVKIKPIKKGENIINVNNSGLSSGTYFYLINLGKLQYYCKFIIIK